MSRKKITVDIKGMHCRSCEVLLEMNISKVPGVTKVSTHYKKGIAQIEYADAAPRMEAIVAAVEESGYRVGKEDVKHFFSHNPMDYVELLLVGSIVFTVFSILKVTGVLSLNPAANAGQGLVGVFVIGLTAGVSTCMALIGGLVLAASSRHAELHPEATALEKFRPHVFFNLGRIVSYTLLGGLIGFIGSALNLSSSFLGILTMILGGVMLFLGLKLINIFPRLENKSFVLPKGISRALGLGEMKEYSHRGSFVTGALTFFVPCGFTQAMQLYAISTGSFTEGALIMGVFALGTLPGLIGIGGLTSVLKGVVARYFFKFAGVVVIALALFNITSGYNLTGFTFASVLSVSEQAPNTSGEVRIENGEQIIEMTQSAGGYSPRQFTVKKGIPVVWKIKGTYEYSCAAYISLPAANIAQPLKRGENIIRFTPTEIGMMRFSCSMGMYSGSIHVID